MNIHCFIRCICILVVASTFETYSGNPQVSGDLENDFAEFVRTTLKEWQAPGVAFSVVKDGELIHNSAFGLCDVESRLPVTTNTLFGIASLTKAFTTAALAMLVDDGLLDWDVPIRSYLPDFQTSDPFITEHLTLRDIVTHRSGLARHDHVWLGTPFTRDELIGSIRWLGFSRGFRQSYQYNNLLYIVAGRVIESVSGIRWEDFISYRLLRPLGMSSTIFAGDDIETRSDFSKSYSVAGTGYEPAPQRDLAALGPAGSMYSNSVDMSKWMLFQLNKGVVRMDTLVSPAQMSDIQSLWVHSEQGSGNDDIRSTGYGLGWRIGSYRGNEIVYHSGAIGGYRALAILVPSHRLGIISLTNINRSQVNQVLAYTFLDRLLGLEPIDWNRRFKSRQSPLRTVRCDKAPKMHLSYDLYTGRFVHPAYGEIQFQVQGKRLIISRYGTVSRMEPCRDHTFRRDRATWGVFRPGITFRFETGTDGSIDRVLIPLEPDIDDIEFIRVGVHERSISSPLMN